MPTTWSQGLNTKLNSEPEPVAGDPVLDEKCEDYDRMSRNSRTVYDKQIIKFQESSENIHNFLLFFYFNKKYVSDSKNPEGKRKVYCFDKIFPALQELLKQNEWQKFLFVSYQDGVATDKNLVLPFVKLEQEARWQLYQIVSVRKELEDKQPEFLTKLGLEIQEKILKEDHTNPIFPLFQKIFNQKTIEILQKLRDSGIKVMAFTELEQSHYFSPELLIGEKTKTEKPVFQDVWSAYWEHFSETAPKIKIRHFIIFFQLTFPDFENSHILLSNAFNQVWTPKLLLLQQGKKINLKSFEIKKTDGKVENVDFGSLVNSQASEALDLNVEQLKFLAKLDDEAISKLKRKIKEFNSHVDREKDKQKDREEGKQKDREEVKQKDEQNLTIGLATGAAVLTAAGLGGFLYWFFKIRK